MCVATMLIAGIGRMYYGASRTVGRDRSRFRAIASDDPAARGGLPVGERRMPAEQKLAAEAMVVLETWAVLRRLGARAVAARTFPRPGMNVAQFHAW
jgi:tRNA(Arg) A34 adenosine deaminase TadA